MIDFIEGGVTAAKGFSAGGVHCGIRKNKTKLDLAMILSDCECSAAAVYTQNLVKGAPILVTKKNLENGKARAVICNSGNANTCNADGAEKAQRMCEIAAEVLGIDPTDVIVASTGVIGETLPIEPIENAAQALKESLDPNGSALAAQGIMTTDTYQKEVAVKVTVGGKEVHIGGISKGSGMIHPNMATMLCFATTDCAIDPKMLQKAISAVTSDTFNMITVDGDTSTNDTFAIMANGMAGNPVITEENEDYKAFVEGLMAVCRKLSQLMAADGEGASKFLTCTVTGAKDKETAKIAARSVAGSTLVKAAVFGRDANCWGRAMCAVGYSGAQVDVTKIELSARSAKGEILLCKDGSGVGFSEEKALEVLGEKDIEILINLHAGDAMAEAWGCDLTYDYVKINADYRT